MKCEMENLLASALEAAEVMNRTVQKIQTTGSLGEAPSKQGVLVCHYEHHALNASGHDQHNSLAGCLLCRSVEEGMVPFSTDGVFQSESTLSPLREPRCSRVSVRPERLP